MSWRIRDLKLVKLVVLAFCQCIVGGCGESSVNESGISEHIAPIPANAGRAAEFELRATELSRDLRDLQYETLEEQCSYLAAGESGARELVDLDLCHDTDGRKPLTAKILEVHDVYRPIMRVFHSGYETAKAAKEFADASTNSLYLIRLGTSLAALDSEGAHELASVCHSLAAEQLHTTIDQLAVEDLRAVAEDLRDVDNSTLDISCLSAYTSSDPAWQNRKVRGQISKAELRICHAAILIRLFKIKHGSTPETLQAALMENSSESIGRYLHDPFGPDDLIYNRGGSPQSRGPDMDDDGGKAVQRYLLLRGSSGDVSL